jgi:ribosomal protein S18 acetylase RimI-like enzyme
VGTKSSSAITVSASGPRATDKFRQDHHADAHVQHELSTWAAAYAAQVAEPAVAPTGEATVGPAITLRPATAHDVPNIVGLVESAYRGQSSRAGWTTEADLIGGQRTDAAAVAALLEPPDNLVLLALAPELLGCCHIQRRGDRAYFGLFAVDPRQQGRGLGDLLLTTAERRAAHDWQAPTMEMTVLAQRPELIAWYVRRGYVATGERRPFPYGDERFGRPLRADLEFVVLATPLA